jgi:hypothetical protein
MKKTCYGIFCSISVLQGGELLYPYRDIHSPPFVLDSNIEIVVCSPPRTGSTLVYNILQYLFEDRSCLFSDPSKRVKKVHNIQPFLKGKTNLQHVYFFCPLRDPLAQFASLVRIGKVSSHRKAFQHCLKESFSFLRYFRKFPHFSFLLYENFEADFSSIFVAVEKAFSIHIEEKERECIGSYFSKKALGSIADSMHSFEEVDPITGIHGMHISLYAPYISPQERKEFEHLSKPLRHTLSRLNYSW